MFSDFISGAGVKPLALVCGVTPSTVYCWKHRNRIPAAKWAAILGAYPKVRWRDLVDMDHASRHRVDA